MDLIVICCPSESKWVFYFCLYFNFLFLTIIVCIFSSVPSLNWICLPWFYEYLSVSRTVNMYDQFHSYVNVRQRIGVRVCEHNNTTFTCLMHEYVLQYVWTCQCLQVYTHTQTELTGVTWQTSERMPVFQKPWLLSSTVTSRRMVFFWRIFWRASCQTTSQSIIDPLEHSLRGTAPILTNPTPPSLASSSPPLSHNSCFLGTCNKLKPPWHDTHTVQERIGATGEVTAMPLLTNWGTAMGQDGCGRWWRWCWR